MRPPMVPSPTNPTTTLSLDIASPPLRFSDFDRHQVSLCGPHCGRPACTKGEMRDDPDGHGGHFPNSPTSRTIPGLLDELAARFPRARRACRTGSVAARISED